MVEFFDEIFFKRRYYIIYENMIENVESETFYDLLLSLNINILIIAVCLPGTILPLIIWSLSVDWLEFLSLWSIKLRSGFASWSTFKDAGNTKSGLSEE